MIDSSEITVIIKGLVIGKKEDKYEDRYTYRSIESVRKHLPNSRIILSTWAGSDVSDLNPDEIIFNKEPDRIEILNKEGEVRTLTVNNQIITSQKGLEEVNTKYSLIIRSDIILTSTGFLKYFEKYNKGECEGFLDKKIVVLPTYSPRRLYRYLFDVSDWVYFGLTRDLKNIFYIPLMDKNTLKKTDVQKYPLDIENLSAEQYVWVSFLQKYSDIVLPSSQYFTDDLNKKSEESYAKNVIMISANRFGIRCLKYPNSAYGAKPWRSVGFYTMSEYNKIYNKYNKHKIFYIKNYFEEIMYFIQVKLRFFIKKYNYSLYKSIVNTFRRFNGNKNLFK